MKKLSHLSFASIALLVAALPALAQTKSVENEMAKSTSDQIVATQVAALAGERLSVHKSAPTSAAVPVASSKQTSLSLERFKQAASQSTATSSFAAQSTIFAQPKLIDSNDNDTASRKRITFVPSRGQKLPCQQ